MLRKRRREILYRKTETIRGHEEVEDNQRNCSKFKTIHQRRNLRKVNFGNSNGSKNDPGIDYVNLSKPVRNMHETI